MGKGKPSLKEEAQRALSRRKWGKALECFQKHCAGDPVDFRSRRKVAELLERLGRTKEALHEYRELAETYARDGYLLQAISLNKIILRIDPALREVNDRLAQLYTARAKEARPARPFPPIPLFSELNETELESLVSEVCARTFQKGEEICHEGDAGDSLMVISQGEAGIFKGAAGEKERWVCNLGEGDLFGEFGFFTDQKRHATVKAVRESVVLEVPRRALQELIETHPRIREVLSRFFQQRVIDLFLAVSPLFSNLSSVEREEIFRRFHPLHVPEETFLFRGGDPPGSLYFIRNGAVEIFIPKRPGKKLVLATLESGDFFGEIGALFNKPRMASAKTVRPSELLELTKVDLDSCLLMFPQVRRPMKKISSERLARMNSEVLSRKSTEQVRETMV